MAGKKLTDRIGAAVKAARREVETVAAKAEREVKRGVKRVATRVKKVAIRVEQSVEPKKPARTRVTPGMQLDKGIARARRAGRKAEAAVREVVVSARKTASKAAARKPAARKPAARKPAAGTVSRRGAARKA